ncbi:MAG TPA: hypothetical protein VMM82_06460, partial [Spirochaetia bacterium]|nr:hypothetical protein [Spirochaetia bacterium]
MMQHNRFREDMLDLEDPASLSDVVRIAGPAASARVEDQTVVLTVPLFACTSSSFEADPDAAPLEAQLRIQSWGGCMVRVTASLGKGEASVVHDLDESPMIQRDPGLTPQPLTVDAGAAAGEYIVRDASGRVVFRTLPPRSPAHPWSTLIP